MPLIVCSGQLSRIDGFSAVDSCMMVFHEVAWFSPGFPAKSGFNIVLFFMHAVDE